MSSQSLIKTGIPDLELEIFEQTLTHLPLEKRLQRIQTEASEERIRACVSERAPLALVVYFSLRINEAMQFSTYERGRIALARGEYDEAERLLLKAIEEDGETVALIDLGLAVFAIEGRNQEAMSIFQRALQLGHSGVHRWLGEFSAERGKEEWNLGKKTEANFFYDMARKSFDAAIAGGDTAIYGHRAWLAFTDGDIPLMMEYFGKYEKLGFKLPVFSPEVQEILARWRTEKAH